MLLQGFYWEQVQAASAAFKDAPHAMARIAGNAIPMETNMVSAVADTADRPSTAGVPLVPVPTEYRSRPSTAGVPFVPVPTEAHTLPCAAPASPSALSETSEYPSVL